MGTNAMPTPEQFVMANRIGAARSALAVHSKQVRDTKEPMKDRIVDLIANLLHLAEEEGVCAPEHVVHLVDLAALHFQSEAASDAA